LPRLASNEIPLISAALVARITGVSHQCQATNLFSNSSGDWISKIKGATLVLAGRQLCSYVRERERLLSLLSVSLSFLMRFSYHSHRGLKLQYINAGGGEI
jgi:hypothetical protein